MEDGLAHNWVYAIAVDSEGAIWFGTWGGGVSKFDPAASTTWTNYTTEDGLASNYVHTIRTDEGDATPGGRVWFWTYDSGGPASSDYSTVSAFDGDSWATYTKEEPAVVYTLPPGTVYARITEADGRSRLDMAMIETLPFEVQITLDGRAQAWFELSHR